MHRIGGYVSILPIESDFDHNKIVDMLQVVTNSLFGVFWIAVSDDQVSRGPNSNLVGNMRWQNELTIVPANLSLEYVSMYKMLEARRYHTLFPRM